MSRSLEAGLRLPAELTDRTCYGIELDREYVDVVVKRWQQLSGQAKLSGNGQTFDEIAAERRRVPA